MRSTQGGTALGRGNRDNMKLRFGDYIPRVIKKISKYQLNLGR